MTTNLKGKTAVVTGSTSGIGLAYARAFASAGANVVINGFGAPADIEKERSAIETDFKVKAAYSAADMTKPAEIADMIGFGEKTFGSVDILVNNAGIQHRKPLVEFTTDEWRKVIETDLTSAFVIGREAGKRMIPRKHGKIINIGSLGSELARPTIAPYTAAKGGIKNLTRSMAVEWAQHGIQANAIGPGYMLTDMNEALVNNTDFNNWLMGRIPSKRWGRPDELVGAAIFLASDASTYVNGQIIYVDGGMIAAM
jgi:gluconate 5-dehydrogenase